MSDFIRKKKFIFCIFLLILSLILTLFFEPILGKKLIFAISFFNSEIKVGSPQFSYGDYVKKIRPIEHGHLPEPSTFILLISGCGGLLIRFVRKSFDRFKRLMDIVLAFFGLIISSPLVCVAAIMIKLTSPGSIIYRQKRVGLNGQVFWIYKLRTMCQDAEKNTGAVWATKDDPRVTPVGRILRKLRIDEIPQLVNVLLGQMSIVGPRPERPEIVNNLKKIIRDYEKRFRVKPGITGLAQVLHKYDESIEDVRQKVRYDLIYIRKRCLMTDLDILIKTIGVVLTGRGAN
ncbi:MAG: sugar transferase [Candidatus Omnitrophica bacterium]|nr:sugar transferase [Candidatus Omnitrophota bacterium]